MGFPKDFFWGTAASAYQTEGGNERADWADWERTPGKTAEPCGVAIDHWNRYESDFALLASMGHNTHRLGVEWSRLETAPGVFDDEAFAHYADVLKSLRDKGLLAFVTLYHFTVPQWFAAAGGWLAPDAVEVFARYVGEVASRLELPYACTINEPQILALESYGLGQFPPGIADPQQGLAVNDVMIRAHRAAVAAIRAVSPDTRIGVCEQLIPFEPLDPSSEADRGAAAFLDQMMVERHLADLAAGGDVGDWVGLQYYTRVRIDGSSPSLVTPPPAGAETTQMGWEVYPAGIGQMLRRLAAVGLPVVITENGIATLDDDQRVRYLRSHLAEVQRALADGVDVRGYLWWTAFDNFEWAQGYRPRFGLVEIDRDDDLARRPRGSAALFSEVIRTGSLEALG